MIDIASWWVGAFGENDFFSGGLMLALIGMITGVLYRLVGPIKEYLRRSYTFTIEIRDREPFRWMAEWLAYEIIDRKCSILSVSEDNALRPGEYDDELRSKAIFVPGRGSHVFWKKGRLIWVHRSLEEATESINGFAVKTETITLSTLGSDPTALKEIVLEAEAAYRERRTHQLSMWCDDGYGSWEERELQTGRSLESVILKEGQAEMISEDVRNFFATRERYVKVGAPYRRGYLFYGPPGCGKSSLAKALATEAAADLYVLLISSSFLNDEKLLRRMCSIKPRSIVVLEDVDAAFSKDRNSSGDNGVTFSGLLNAIDGVASPEGRILIMTTNYRERLEGALIRSGRADLHLQLESADSDMASRLFLRFFPEHLIHAEQFGKEAESATPAAIQKHLFLYWDDPEGAISSWEKREHEGRD